MKEIKEAIMDVLKGQINYANNGMMSHYRVMPSSHMTMRRNNIKIIGNTVTMNDEPVFIIERRYAKRKAKGCYAELLPTLKCVQ